MWILEPLFFFMFSDPGKCRELQLTFPLFIFHCTRQQHTMENYFESLQLAAIGRNVCSFRSITRITHTLRDDASWREFALIWWTLMARLPSSFACAAPYSRKILYRLQLGNCARANGPPSDGFRVHSLQSPEQEFHLFKLKRKENFHLSGMLLLFLRRLMPVCILTKSVIKIFTACTRRPAHRTKKRRTKSDKVQSEFCAASSFLNQITLDFLCSCSRVPAHREDDSK